MADMVFSGVTFTGGYSIALPSVATDPYFMYNSLLLPGDGTNTAQNNTFLDGSTNNFSITRNGNTTQGTFSPYGPNWSNYFSGGYLTFTGTSAVNLYAAQFTFECWVYKASTGLAQHIYGYNNATLDFWDVYIDASERIVFRYNGNSANITTSTTVPLAQWTHIAIAYDGSTSRIFINGILAGSAASGIVTANGNYPANIGINLYSGGVSPFYGYMSNMRIIKGSALYTANFTPSTAPLTAISGTSLLTCQSNRFKDNSTNAFTLTVTNSPTIQRFSPFSPTQAYDTSTTGGSGYFDGSDYLTVPTTTTLSFGTGDFTVEVWVYKTTAINSSVIDARVEPGTASPWAFFINENNFPYFYQGTIYASTIAVTLNTWTHIVAVRNSGVLKIYVNGVQGLSVALATNLDRTAGAFIGSGADSVTPGSYFAGYMSNMRVVKGTAVYTSNFTPPTAPLTAIANTSLLLNYTNAGIIDNAMMNNLETVGNAQISTTQSKFGGSSMSFDGTGDSLFQPSNLNYGYGTGDFTIEFWLYLNATTTQSIVNNLTAASGASVAPHIYYANASGIRYYVNSADRITGSALSTGVWYHIAVCRSVSSTKMFINGTQTGSTYTDTNNYGTSNPLGVGDYAVPQTGTFTLNGYIDDLRVTKGYARYTSNFTPPTSAFPLY